MLRVLYELINGASEDDLGILVPPSDRGDITAAFIIDYGTPARLRLIAKCKARDAVRRCKAEELHALWMRRLAASASKAMRAGRALNSTMTKRPSR